MRARAGPYPPIWDISALLRTGGRIPRSSEYLPFRARRHCAISASRTASSAPLRRRGRRSRPCPANRQEYGIPSADSRSRVQVEQNAWVTAEIRPIPAEPSAYPVPPGDFPVFPVFQRFDRHRVDSLRHFPAGTTCSHFHPLQFPASMYSINRKGMFRF